MITHKLSIDELYRLYTLGWDVFILTTVAVSFKFDTSETTDIVTLACYLDAKKDFERLYADNPRDKKYDCELVGKHKLARVVPKNLEATIK